jgi:hypothetical protein
LKKNKKNIKKFFIILIKQTKMDSSLRRRFSRLSPAMQSRLTEAATELGIDIEPKKKGGFMTYIISFLIISVVTYVILYTWNPSFLRQNGPDDKPTENVDPMKVLLASVLVGLLGDVVVWLVKRK